MSDINKLKDEYLHKRHRRWQFRRIATVLGCVVVVMTAFALMVPAITMTRSDTAATGGEGNALQSVVFDVDKVGEMSASDASVSDPSADAASDESEDATPASSEDATLVEVEAQATEAENPDGMSAQLFEDTLAIEDGEELTISIEAGENDFPSGTTMKLEKVERSAIEDAVDQVVSMQGGIKVVGIQAVDIAFYDEQGNAVEPAEMVTVKFASDRIAKGEGVLVVHVDEDGVEALEPLGDEALELRGKSVAEDELFVDSDAFSPYALVFTADFSYEVGGGLYEYAINDDMDASFKSLVQELGVMEDDPDTDLDEVAAFVEDVKSVVFSNPALMSVVPVTEPTTVGAIKDEQGLVCEYSAALSQDRIARLDAQELAPVDWALISLKPFNDIELLTVTMQDGQQFLIYVSDERASENALAADGPDYRVVVTYDDEAAIPQGSQLSVTEIGSDTDEYESYLAQSAEALGREDVEDISFARFFDIEIRDAAGQKVEPATPVQVRIEYDDELEVADDATLNIVHFAEEEGEAAKIVEGTEGGEESAQGEEVKTVPEVITDVELNDDATTVTYEQGSFSVTGTIVANSTTPSAGSWSPSSRSPRYYMVLIKYEGEYYIIRNNGDLVKVDSYQNDSGEHVLVANPMLWSYVYNNGNGYHLYHDSNAVGFTNQDVASDFYYRYIDPNSQTGIITDDKTDPDFTTSGTSGQGGGVSVTNRPLWSQTSIVYDHANHTLRSDTHGGGASEYYLGVVDENGTLKLTGRNDAAHAAEVYLATSDVVKDPHWTRNSVGHIDISISGTTDFDIPLPYGQCYDENHNPLEGWDITPTSANSSIFVSSLPIGIDIDDMKRSTITAFKKNSDGTTTSMDDMYELTGFSENAANSTSGSAQVRMEGSFKVADIDDVNEWRYNNDSTYRDQVRTNRKAHRVYYTVTCPKTMTIYLKTKEHMPVLPENATDEQKEAYREAYVAYWTTPGGPDQLYNSEGNTLSSPVSVSLSANFDYWDEGNTCPGFRDYDGDDGVSNWRAGHIATHNQSGMDFVLGGDSESGHQMRAIEITKYIVDEEGNQIHPDRNLEHEFIIYYDRDGNPNDVATLGQESFDTNEYAPVHHTEQGLPERTPVTVGSSGMARVFDSAVNDGMYYITEDPNTVPNTITDLDGTQWSYTNTHFETEYVWRGTDGQPRHKTASVKKSNGETAYTSIPEILGEYEFEGCTASDGYAANDGEKPENSFLEFFVYNVYKKGVDLEVEKLFANGIDAPASTEVDIELYCATRMIADSEGAPPAEGIAAWPDADDYKAIADESLLAGKVSPTSITLRPDSDAEKNLKGVFKDLPHTVTDAAGNVYEVDYYARETRVMMNGIDVTNRYKATTAKTQPDAGDVNISDGKITITNSIDTLNVAVQKVWDPTPESGSVKVQLKRYKKPLPDTDVAVTKVWDDDNNRDGKRPAELPVTLYADGEATDTVVTLNPGNSWTATVSKPVAVGDRLVNYSWQEVAVEGYTSQTAVNGTTTTITNSYTPEMIDVTLTVNWDDLSNSDGSRPASVQATLLADGDAVETVTLEGDSTAPSWTKTLTVPKYDEGQEIAYSWTKPSIPDDYTKTAEDDNSITFHHDGPSYHTLNITTNGKHGSNGPDPQTGVRYLAGTPVTFTVSERYSGWNFGNWIIRDGENGPVLFERNSRNPPATISLSMNRDYDLWITCDRSDGWYNDWLIYELTPDSNVNANNTNSTNGIQASGSASSDWDVRMLAAGDETGSRNLRATTPADAEPLESGSLPAGYVEDMSFTSVEMTLDGTNGWTQSFPDAYPKYDLAGQPYYYVVEEIDKPEGYYIESYVGNPIDSSQVGESGTGTVEVKNTRNRIIDVTIHKVDEEDFEDATAMSFVPLPGAQFTLVKYSQLSPKDIDEGWGTGGEMTVSEDPSGVFRFTDLTPGFYEIFEDTPPGYVQQDENPIFEVTANLEVFLVYPSGEHIGEHIDNNATDMVKVDATTITVGNVLGVALPLTGGVGTNVFEVLGFALVAVGAGILIVRRRRQLAWENKYVLPRRRKGGSR